MDYEKMYKEAIEDMRVIYPNLKGDAKLAVEHAFPELAESEDERIIEGFHKLIKQIREKKGLTLNCVSLDRCEAWLEKQKDTITDVTMTEAYKMGLEAGRAQEEAEKFFDSAQSYHEGFVAGQKQKENPKSADSIPSDCMSDAKCEDRWHKVGDSLPDNPREVLCKDEAGNYFIGRYYSGEGWEISNYDDEDKPHHLNPPVSKWIDFPSEKQKEQKPSDMPPGFYFIDLDGKKFYSKEFRYGDIRMKVVENKPAEKQDYSGLNDLERAILRGFLCAGVENVPVTIIKETAQDCLAQMKPVEWSEEDEKNCNRIIQFLEPNKTFFPRKETKEEE